jgi:NitT/TauT family transport system permease protein
VNFFRALPPIALIPLVVVYFGIGESARLSVLVYAAFFSGVIVIYEGVRGLEPVYIRAGKALGASQAEIFSRIVLPLSVPTILVALRVALGVSWATLVAAELIAAQEGLGALIQEAGNFFQIPVIYGGIILIGVAALIMDGVLRVITARIVRWREEVTG